jgi:AcrR family transcriptional regulator
MMLGGGSPALAGEVPAARSRRERRKREVRDRIVAAALALFDAKGFGRTTVAEICERADVAHKTFFNYFTTKQHVLRDIARIELDVLLGLIEQASQCGGSTRERLERFFRLLAERIETAGPMRRELVTELVHVGHEAGTQSEQARTVHNGFGRLLRKGLAGGDLTRRHRISTLTEIVVGTFYALMFNWANFENYPFRRQALAAARVLGDAVTAPRRNA